MASSLTICNPVVADPKPAGRLAPLPEAIEGTRVGFRIQWDSFDVFMQEMEPILREQYGVRDVHRWSPESKVEGQFQGRAANPEVRARQTDKFAEQSDWAILGLAA